MASEEQDTTVRYLRMFSYLLIICGLIEIACGVAVIYQTVHEGGISGLSLASAALGLASAAAGGIAFAAGLMGRVASREPGRLGSLYTLALAGIVATVLGLGLCYATGGNLPTSLLFNGLLMVIGAVIAANLRKTSG